IMAVAKKATKKTTKKATASRGAAAKSTAKPTAKKTAKKTSAKKSTKKTAARGSNTAFSGNVVVASKGKEGVRAGDVRMAGDFPEALNAEVQEVIAKAIQRAKDNGRGTVRPSDL